MLSPKLDILSYFLIPFGFGIPSGIIKAKEYQIDWPLIILIYFISDLILAFIFEPILVLLVRFGKGKEKFVRFGEAFKLALKQTTERIGTGTGPFALILFTFGSDPMTGRLTAMAAGHGFITGWIIAIAGDMMYFSVILASTLWLNNIVDGSTTVMIIFVAMIAIPMIIKKLRKT